MKSSMAENDSEETTLLQILHIEFGELRDHVDRLLRAALNTDLTLEERASAVAGIRDLVRFAKARERMHSE
jgi:hypothetical protein